MAECLTPFYVKDRHTKDQVPVPCGKCPVCSARRISGWSFRLMKEGERSSSSFFVTLTYDTNHVPITKTGYMSLSKEHLQKYFKRLRKLNDEKLKYYAVGEYGGKTMRPHYHIILFNAKLETVLKAWALDGKYFGDYHVGKVTEASIGYTMKYISKSKKIPQHKNDDRLPEFALMSKRMGDNYLTDLMVKWHKLDIGNRMYCNLKDGKKIAMPRYYKQKLNLTENEQEKIQYEAKIRSIREKISAERKYGKPYADIIKSQVTAQFNKRLRTEGKGEKL
jgi:hypothetical protein